MKKSMKLRIALGLTMAVVVLGGLWLDWFLQARAGFRLTALPMAILLVAIAALAFKELSRMAAASGVGTLWVSGLVGTAAVATMPAWLQWAHLPGVTFMGLIILGIFVEQMIRHRVSDALRRIACTSLAVMYVGVGLALMLLIRMHWGVPILLLFLTAVKLTDVGAYFTGSAFGKHKLIVWLSPGKSWEGLVGGIATAAAACLLATWLLRIDIFGPPMSACTIWRTMLFGAVVGAAGQLADLCESLLKRSSGLKDSGALLPEFGGILDIIDSPLLAAPVAVVLLNVLA
jgi:phosphatidate cytidylyltransferase